MSKLALLAATLMGAAFCAAGCAGSTIHNAAYNGMDARVEEHLRQGRGIDERFAMDGGTPLMYAVQGRKAGTVRFLLEKGADPSLTDARGSTALDYSRDAEITRLLKEAGAAAGTAPARRSVAALAAAGARPLGTSAGPSAARPAPSPKALHKAVLEDSSSRVAAELDKGADIDAYHEGLTPLMSAAMNGSAGMVRFLLDRGANPHLASQYKKRTALEGMQFSSRDRSESEKQEIAALLREAAGLASPAPRRAPGNLDDAAYDRMRAAAGMAPEPRGPVSDVDSPAKVGAERPDDFALVIGVESYQSLPKADHGERDAKTVRKHLEALGFPARNIVSLEGSGATKSKLESYLKEWLPLNVKPSSTLFVYYSGHGAPDPKSGDAYLVPWDGDPKFLKSTAYPLAQLYADLSKTKAKRVIVALDACFSGAGGRSVLAQGARPLVAKVADIAAGDRVTVLAAASGDEITGTLEEQGHGMFTYHLLKGLSADPKASARSLHGYLLPKVQDDARRQNREQTPTLAGASLDAPLLP